MSTASYIPVFNREVDVSLILMPYASLERPSIALSILKSSLNNIGVSSSVIYGNIMLAEKIGAHIYDVINKSQSNNLAGEWTFSRAAFPEMNNNGEAFFEHIAYGLGTLQPYIEHLGSSMNIREVLTIIRNVADEYIEELAHQVLATKPKIVGCSSTFQQHCASLAILKKIKEINPSVTTMIGGANCEASMGIVTHKECNWIDYVVSGEADLIFPELTKRILTGNPYELNEIPHGVIAPIHREKNSYSFLEIKPPRAKLKSMEDSPIPDYDDYFEFVENASCGQFIKPGLLLESSRGCWWGDISHCTFCGLNGESMAHRSKDPMKFLDEINSITSKYGITSVEIVDNILDMSYFNNMIPQLAEENKGYDIFYETKSNLNKQKLQMLSDAGIRWLQPGIESLDNEILQMIGKGTSSRINLQLMKWAQEKGIFILWILLYDLPGERDEPYVKMAEWLPSISHFQPPSGLSFIQINRFSPYQMRPEEYGINLSADKSYSFVYPWSEDSINKFAYFFDDYSIERPVIDYTENGKPNIRPGIDAIKDVIGYWQNEWNIRRGNNTDPESHQGNLIYTDEKGVLTVYDSRSKALNNKYIFNKIERAIYLICDQFRTLNFIQKQLKNEFEMEVSSQEIQKVLDALTQAKIMLLLEEQYFSLALKFPLYRTLPSRHNYPGGRLYSKIEAKNLAMLKYAEQALY